MTTETFLWTLHKLKAKAKELGLRITQNKTSYIEVIKEPRPNTPAGIAEKLCIFVSIYLAAVVTAQNDVSTEVRLSAYSRCFVCYSKCSRIQSALF